MGDRKQLSILHKQLQSMLGAGKGLSERLCRGQLEIWLEHVPESEQIL